MGSINLVWDPIYWRLKEEGINRDNPNDIILNMIIGEGEDESYYEITMLISKINYEKILNKKYKIEKFPYSEIKVLLFDEEDYLIPLVIGDKIDLNKLSTYQREVLNKHYINLEENKKKIKRM